MTRRTFACSYWIAGLLLAFIAMPALQAQEKQGDPKVTASLLGEYVTFAEVGLKLRQPKGFQKEKTFVGFGNEASKSSILINKLPAPFGEVSKGFTKENLAARGWTLHTREDIKLDDQPAVLIHFEQPLGLTVFEKWALLLGDEKKTLLITATFPQASKKELEPALKAAVLSTRPDATPLTKPADALPFTVEVSKKLKVCDGITRTLMYNLDGQIPAKSAEDPLLIIAPSIGNTSSIIDKKAYAQRRIQQFPQTKDVEVQSTKEVTIDDWKGYEIEATGVDQKSGTALKLYQVMLFEEGAYIVAIGMVGEKSAKEYLPEFKAMTASIKRREQGK